LSNLEKVFAFAIAQIVFAIAQIVFAIAQIVFAIAQIVFAIAQIVFAIAQIVFAIAGLCKSLHQINNIFFTKQSCTVYLNPGLFMSVLYSADIGSAGGEYELHFKSNKRFGKKRKALHCAHFTKFKAYRRA
jgi:hypothetical protein